MADPIGADDGGNNQDQEGRGGPATMNEPDPIEDRIDAVDEAAGGGRDDRSIVSRDWVEAQGEGVGLDSRALHDPDEPASAAADREAGS